MSEDIAAAPETADPAALSLALAGASREEADAFLRDQRHHLHEQLKQIHLDIWEKKLGEALAYSGKPAEAKAQFARAAALDLTPSEKSELMRTPHG